MGTHVRVLLAIQDCLDGHKCRKLLLVRIPQRNFWLVEIDQQRSLWKYARYFAKRHPKVIEDENAVEVVIRLEEDAAAKRTGIGRRLTVRTVRTVRNEDE